MKNNNIAIHNHIYNDEHIIKNGTRRKRAVKCLVVINDEQVPWSHINMYYSNYEIMI